ncbi:MAG: hypothetical protein HY093_00005, partial [Candidatus Liptonbacteria bacterium]|nr:hypothetical protein [Candidatus Liptonbacteria bacterium]
MSSFRKKFISVALTTTTSVWLIGATIFVPVANGATAAELQAQVAALLAQINALTAQLN